MTDATDRRIQEITFTNLCPEAYFLSLGKADVDARVIVGWSVQVAQDKLLATLFENDGGYLALLESAVSTQALVNRKSSSTTVSYLPKEMTCCQFEQKQSET